MSDTEITVRAAKLSDAKAIAEIHVEAWAAAYTGIIPQDHLNSQTLAKREALWQDAIKYAEPQVWVALDANAIVGFVGFDRSRDPKSKATMGEIWAMYAAPDYWGEGVGLALWDAARDGLVEEGCSDVTLWVLLKNERALRFYELAGFKREMNTAKTVPMGSAKVDEIRMKRSLA